MKASLGSHHDRLFNAMTQPEFYPHPVTAIEQVQTHISMVFLTGSFVYKIKKPVHLEFLDYSTLTRRKYFCQQETILNRRLSTNVYLGTVAITEYNGVYQLNGSGPPVEYAVKMRQLPDDRRLIPRLQREEMDHRSIKALVRRLVRFYGRTKSGKDVQSYGAVDAVRRNCEENFLQLRDFVGTVLDPYHYDIVRSATRSFLKCEETLFQRRIDSGQVRDCHGDLRTDHIYFDDGIQIIDCIEFNSRFRYSDVVSDLAFLAMDLDFRGFDKASRKLMEVYAEMADDPGAYTLLDFYKCYRAMVRCKVACFRLRELDPGVHEYRYSLREADDFLNLALRYAFQFIRPTLWVVCGLPASGKSTIAARLCALFDLPLLSSDRVRKELFGLRPHHHVVVPFERGIYSKGASGLTYGRLLLSAQDALKRGKSVVLDATFSRLSQREEAMRLARDLDVDIIFVECRASTALLLKRLIRREAHAETSDARSQHLEHFMQQYEPPIELPGTHRITIETDRPTRESLQRILRIHYATHWKEVTLRFAA